MRRSAELAALGWVKLAAWNTQCHPVPPPLAQEEGQALPNPGEPPSPTPKRWGILEAEAHDRFVVVFFGFFFI